MVRIVHKKNGENKSIKIKGVESTFEKEGRSEWKEGRKKGVSWEILESSKLFGTPHLRWLCILAPKWKMRFLLPHKTLKAEKFHLPSS